MDGDGGLTNSFCSSSFPANCQDAFCLTLGVHSIQRLSGDKQFRNRLFGSWLGLDCRFTGFAPESISVDEAEKGRVRFQGLDRLR